MERQVLSGNWVLKRWQGVRDETCLAGLSDWCWRDLDRIVTQQATHACVKASQWEYGVLRLVNVLPSTILNADELVNVAGQRQGAKWACCYGMLNKGLFQAGHTLVSG